MFDRVREATNTETGERVAIKIMDKVNDNLCGMFSFQSPVYSLMVCIEEYAILQNATRQIEWEATLRDLTTTACLFAFEYYTYRMLGMRIIYSTPSQV